MADEVFIGTVEEYEEYQKKQASTPEASEVAVKKIAYDDMVPISDEDLKILKQTRNRHDAWTVYMQSDEKFYDGQYHSDKSEEDELLTEARKIKRLYKSYPKYLYAMHIRDLYLDSLVEKYGGVGMFNQCIVMGVVQDWIPPKPIFSKSSAEYDQYLTGRIEILTRTDVDDDRILELTEQLTEELRIDVSKVGVRGDVITAPYILYHLNDGAPVQSRPMYMNNSINGVSTSDLMELQRMFRSWYEEDTVQVDPDDKLFCDTPAKIRERYYTRPLVDMGGIKFGQPIIEEDPDPNEMVIDQKLNRPMTRSELNKREFIRMMAEAGWSEMRLMRYLDVGSKYEQELMFQRHKRRKSAKKKAGSLIDAIVGNPGSTGFVDELEMLRGALFDDGD